MWYRKKWLFKPKVTPDKMPRLREVASISELGVVRQFEWKPQEASPHSFEMQAGIMAVWSDASRSEAAIELPGTALDFFSDMHRQSPASTCGIDFAHVLRLLRQLGGNP